MKTIKYFSCGQGPHCLDPDQPVHSTWLTEPDIDQMAVKILEICGDTV